MAISLADAAKLRSSHHRVELTLNRVPLVVVASAQINQSSFTYPINSFVVGNASVDWTTKVKRGMAFSIGTEPGGHDITWGTVKATPGVNTFTFDAKTLGDSGYAIDIHLPIEDDHWITVYQHRPMWGILSAVRNKIFYKDYDQTYVSQGSQPSPVQNLGEHRQAFVDPITGTAQLTFTSEVLPWGSATVSSRAWSCDGATAIGSETGASVTYEFEPGFYIVQCVATDSNSKTQTSYRYVFVNDKNGVYPAVENWTDAQATSDRSGLKMSFALNGDYTEDDIYPGQFWMVSKRCYYNGAELDDTDALEHSFCGYLSERSISRDISSSRVELQAESPILYARRIGAVSQQITEKVSPANWTQATSVLTNPPGATWYILQHHAPNILAGHDFIFDSTLKTLRKQSFVFQAGSIGAQLNFIQELVPGNIGCRSDGAIVLSAIATYMTDNDRNTLDNKFEWTERDIRPPLTYSHNFHPPTRVVKGNAFAYAGGTTAIPYMSRAESSQGSSSGELTVIVPVAIGQNRLNEITGHHLAIQNAPTPQTPFDANRCMDIASPVDCNVWHTWVIPPQYDPMGIGWVNKRVLPLRVSRAWRNSERGMTEQLSMEWETETFGQPGITVPVPRGDASGQLEEGYNTQLPTPFDPKFPLTFGMAWDEDGYLGRTSSLNSSAPAWKPLNTGLAGIVEDVTFDYASDFFATGSGSLGAWVITRDGNDIKTYYASDVRLASTVSWTLQHTNVAASIGHARIGSSKTDTLIERSAKYSSGTKHFRSTDGGSSFTSEGINTTQISPRDLTENDTAEVGLAVDGVKKLVTHADTDGQYELYGASTATGAFSVIGGSPSADSPFPMIAVDGQGNAYASTPPDLPIFNETVTFDGEGYADYTLVGVNGTATLGTGTVGAGAYLNATLVNQVVLTQLKAELNLDEERKLRAGTDFSFNWKIKWTGTPVLATNTLVIALQGDSLFDSDSYDLFANPGLNDVWQTYEYTGAAGTQTEVIAYMSMGTLTDLTQVEFFIDNVQLTQPDTPSTPDVLYRVDDYNGTPAWNAITPSGDYTPRYPYALAVDPFTPDRILMVADSGSGQHLFGSDDNGDTWQDGGLTTYDYRGCKVAGDLLILFGDGVIRLSNDNGATFNSRLGNWASAIGTVNTFRGLVVAIGEA